MVDASFFPCWMLDRTHCHSGQCAEPMQQAMASVLVDASLLRLFLAGGPMGGWGHDMKESGFRHISWVLFVFFFESTGGMLLSAFPCISNTNLKLTASIYSIRLYWTWIP